MPTCPPESMRQAAELILAVEAYRLRSGAEDATPTG
jgi:hypothetical protein